MKSKTKTNLRTTSEKIHSSELERIKLDLLSLVSHELRTPLTSVLNSIRVLNDEDLNPTEKKEFLDLALRNAEKLNVKLNEILDLSRLVTGKLFCHFQEVSLAQLLQRQFDLLTSQAEREGVLTELPDPTAIQKLSNILGDPFRLEQVFLSLFENAIEFSPPQGKVQVDLKASPKVLKFTVENTIAESHIEDARKSAEKNFEIFAQNEPILTRSHEGLGGSLAIANEVIRQHGGKLIAIVKDDRFTVTLELPILEGDAALLKVLESRLFALTNDIGAVSLVVLKVKKSAASHLVESIKSTLFRASDSVYRLDDKDEIAVLMDDCKKKDAPKILKRLLKSLGTETINFLNDALVGIGHGPEDTVDPEKLLRLARESRVPIQDYLK